MKSADEILESALEVLKSHKKYFFIFTAFLGLIKGAYALCCTESSQVYMRRIKEGVPAIANAHRLAKDAMATPLSIYVRGVATPAVVRLLFISFSAVMSRVQTFLSKDCGFL